jgi:FKBP-type peptidyl-prolyl cis-trans isomerase SlyD
VAQVSEGQVTILHYSLTGDDGAVIETTRGEAPVAVLVGHGHLVPGLERAITGRSVGERFEVVVPPADGYGERTSPGAQPVSRREFPRDARLVEGMPLRLRGADGEPTIVWVTKVQGSQVWIDVDHPLAGKTLHFDVEVIATRPATDDELAHGHAHGAEGHGH